MKVEKIVYEVCSGCDVIGRFKTLKEARECKRNIDADNKEIGYDENITIEKEIYVEE